MRSAKDEGKRKDGDLLDAGEVARMLNVGVRSIWRWSDARRMPAPVRLGRLRRWRLLDIVKWIENGCRPLEER